MSEPTTSGEAAGLSAPAPESSPAETHLTLAQPPRAGELSLGWRVVTAFCWIAVVMALAAVWNTSVQLGLSTWWLGPRAQPQPLPVRLSPFVAPVLMVLATINHVRWLCWWGLGAAATVVTVGLVDLGYVASLAVVEISIGVAAAMVSVASLTGTYRAASRTDPDPDSTDSG